MVLIGTTKESQEEANVINKKNREKNIIKNNKKLNEEKYDHSKK